jgi:Na+/H+ antiporter NhaD/arsenite permease-like protein
MKLIFRRGLLLILVCTGLLLFFTGSKPAQAQDYTGGLIFGQVVDRQGQPVAGAKIFMAGPGNQDALASAVSQADGSFSLSVEETAKDTLLLKVERAHFTAITIELTTQQLDKLQQGGSVNIDKIQLIRVVNSGFWAATLVFVIVLVLIASGKLHTTMSALVGTALLYALSYLGRLADPDLFIFNFRDSMAYIDWNVIFLVMGMMIVIAIVEHTGIFQWMAFFSYRISGGRMLVLLPLLMLMTGVASAFLDNVTTMLLMTPMTVQIAIALGINPLALLIPEVMASNVIGVSTLVGTPTNILIGSFGRIGFNDFLINLTPGVLLSFVGLVVYSIVIYRKDLLEAHKPTPLLLKKLEERGQITEMENLKKAGVVGAGMMALFILGEEIGLVPAVTAIMGATALLVWIKPDIEAMIEAVDWTTLVFFMSLFIVVGGIQEVGLVSLIAEGIGKLVGENLALAMVAIVWASALLSLVIANIPFTAAMLPVIGYLTATIPGAQSKVLFYCLSVGSAMGGNGTLIGASANMVTAGIAEAAGYKISYMYFLRKGLPAVLITVGLATIWLFIRF